MRLVLLLSFLAVAFCADEPAVPAAETTLETAAPVVPVETTEKPAVPAETVASTAAEAAATPAATPEAGTTPAAGATTAPGSDAAAENEQAVEVLSGDYVLHRGWNGRKKMHIYTTDGEKLKPSYVNKEGVVGYVATEKKFEELKAKCPDLLKTYIFTLITGATYIDQEGLGKDKAEVFYCAPKKGYCGAHYPLQRLAGKPWQNYYYPSTKEQGIGALKMKNGIYKTAKTVCYIWRPVQSIFNDKFKTVRDAVLAEKMEIQGCLVTSSPSMHKFALDKADSHSIKKEKCTIQKGVVATVMTPELQAKSAADCPDLVKMAIYQKKSGYPTIISKDAPKEADFEKGPEFYCAPKRGYCGADKEIALFRSKDDFFYPENEYAEMMTRQGRYVYSPKKEPLCWGWTDVKFAPAE